MRPLPVYQVGMNLVKLCVYIIVIVIVIRFGQTPTQTRSPLDQFLTLSSIKHITNILKQYEYIIMKRHSITKNITVTMKELVNKSSANNPKGITQHLILYLVHRPVSCHQGFQYSIVMFSPSPTQYPLVACDRSTTIRQEEKGPFQTGLIG